MEPDEAEAGYERCGATTKQGGDPCKKAAGAGTDHPGIGACKLHGGSTPTHIKGAKRVMAAREVEKFGLPVNIDPITALLDEVHRTAGHVAWLHSCLESTDTVDLEGVYMDAYRQERGHLVKVCTAAINAGVAEAQVRLVEAQSALLVEVITGLLEDLGKADDPEAREFVRRRLALVAAA